MMDGSRMIFIDETAASTKMAQSHGWSVKGKRLIASVPHGHWCTSTAVAAIGAGGTICAAVQDGGMNKAGFVHWIGHVLRHHLRSGDVVVMDNLAAHKAKEVRQLIESVGATVRYLPAYSPDLNPIELAFSRVKRHLRRAARRTKEALQTAIGEALQSLTPTECQNYIRHCGYPIDGTSSVALL